MAATLAEALLSDSIIDAVRADVRDLIDAEVSEKKGASGLVVKGGYGAVKKVSPSIIEDAIAKLWPGLVEKLEPFWAQYSSAPSGVFAAYLVANGDAAADALLGVTDSRFDAMSKSVVKKTYSSLRPSAKKNVVEALPRIGALVSKWAA